MIIIPQLPMVHLKKEENASPSFFMKADRQGTTTFKNLIYYIINNIQQMELKQISILTLKVLVSQIYNIYHSFS